MKTWLYLYFLFLFFVVDELVYAARKKSSSSSSSKIDVNAKTKSLSSLVDSSGVIYLNDTTFRRYILQGPRAYSALLMITSNTDQLPCQPCRVLTKEFKKVATAYKRQIHGVYTDFFFVIADVANCTEEITKLKDKIRGVPIIVPIRTTTSNSKEFVFDPNYDLFSGLPEGTTTATLANWIAEVTGIKLNQIKEYMTTQRTSRKLEILRESKIATITLLVFVGLLLGLLISRSFTFFQNRSLSVFTLACAVYFIVISGTVYNLINTPPPLYLDDRGIWWFYPGVRLQLQVEGYVMGIFHVAATVGIILIADWFPRRNEKGTATRLHFYGILALALLSMGFVVHIIKRKAPYYPYGI